MQTTTDTPAAPAADNEKPIGELTVAECDARLAELERKRQDLLHARDVLDEAQQAAIRKGRSDQILEAMRGLERIRIDLSLVEHQRRQLRERRKAAEEEERRARAPQELAELLGQLEDLMDRFEAAWAEASEARAALEAWTRRVPELRQLTGDTGRAVDPETLLRLGRLLNRKLETVPDHVETTNAAGGRSLVPVLFGGPGVGLNLMDLLGAPDTSILERLAELLRGRYGTPGRSSAYSATDVREARYRLLARSDPGLALSARAIAEEVALSKATSEARKRDIRDALSLIK